jgi:tRNA pseudouridine55 synthase
VPSIGRSISSLRLFLPLRHISSRMSATLSAEHRDKRLRVDATAKHSVHNASNITDPPEPNTSPHPERRIPGIPRHRHPTDQQQQRRKKAIVQPTSVPCGALPEDLSVWDNAVLLVDKPKGWTSFDVCGKIRGGLAGLLGRKPLKIKVGHAGTLDPMATGLLIVCVGRGTKAIDSFVGMKKEYSGALRLGEGTDSYDADGTFVERQPWEHVTDDTLYAARDDLVGDIDQLPPMFSAIRVDGKRLYESARQGKEVERKPRKVTVERFDLERETQQSQDVKFYVVCSKGTYVRSLAHDLGRAAGTAAHLTALRREAIGEYRVQNAWPMEQLASMLYEQRQRLHAVEEKDAGEGKVDCEQVTAEGGGRETPQLPCSRVDSAKEEPPAAAH